MSAISPTNNPGLLIDNFILYATSHLSTVSGIVTTTSLYPPIGTPGPGVVNWSGYTVDPATPSAVAPPIPPNADPNTDPEALAAQQATLDEDIREVKKVRDEATDVQTQQAADEFIKNAEERKQINEVIKTDNPVNEDDKKVEEQKIKDEEKKNSPKSKTTKKIQNKNLDLIEKALIKVGITNPEIIKAVKANALKESNATPLEENMNYCTTSNERIISIFGSRASKYKEKELNTIKCNAQSMGDLMYGPDSGNVGKWLGNNKEGDGYKYRGRGFIQLTGKANYTAFSLATYKNTSVVENPSLLATAEIAADNVAWYMNRSLNTFAKKMGISTTAPSQLDANLLITSMVAGSPISRSGKGFLTVESLAKVDKYSLQV